MSMLDWEVPRTSHARVLFLKVLLARRLLGELARYISNASPVSPFPECTFPLERKSVRSMDQQREIE